MNAATNPHLPKALRDTHVTMAHGGGGTAMRDLIESVFTSVFEPPGMEDQARLMTSALQEPGARLAFTTDSFVVTPLEFTGGDIGTIAVCGTVNDLAVGGARPLWLSSGIHHRRRHRDRAPAQDRRFDAGSGSKGGCPDCDR